MTPLADPTPDPRPAPSHGDEPPAAFPRLHRILESGAVAVSMALLVWMGVRLARGLETSSDMFWLSTAMLLGYLLADLLSGIVHWMGDTLGNVNTPWFGPAFAQPFREHHEAPRAIAAHGFIETNGNTCIVALPPMVAAHLWMIPTPGWRFYLAAFVVSLALFGIATNQCHKWAHSLRVPRSVTLLQRWGLIIGPDHHERHHMWPHRTHYCVLSGWMNVVADRLRLFRGAEALIRRTRPTWLNKDAVEPALAPPAS